MKGIDKLINEMAICDCPSQHFLTNVNYEQISQGSTRCKYGSGPEKSVQKCIECFEQALEKDYEEDQPTG